MGHAALRLSQLHFRAGAGHATFRAWQVQPLLYTISGSYSPSNSPARPWQRVSSFPLSQMPTWLFHLGSPSRSATLQPFFDLLVGKDCRPALLLLCIHCLLQLNLCKVRTTCEVSPHVEKMYKLSPKQQIQVLIHLIKMKEVAFKQICAYYKASTSALQTLSNLSPLKASEERG